MARQKLKVQVIVSGFVGELIYKLHDEYPNTERSWIWRIEKRDWYYEVTDIRFPKQTNSWGNTEIKDGWLDTLLEDIFNNNPEQLGEWKVRVHSHHSMWVFRSWTDAAAKASFNDGNQDFRWSIVTAYKDDKITYKCALNVFQPTEIEFDVPVKAADFDPTLYFQNPEIYQQEYEKLTATKDAALAEAALPYIPTAEDITKLLSIFNVEDDEENRASCLEILEKNNKSKTKGDTKNIIALYNMEVEELKSFFEWDMFWSKLKELKDNIITAYQYVQPAAGYWHAADARAHYAMGDMDYPNPYLGQQPLFPVATDCKSDKPKTLEQQQYEEDMTEYYKYC